MTSLLVSIWEKKFGRNANHKKKEAEAHATVFDRKTAKPQRHTFSDSKKRAISSQGGAGKDSNNVRGANSSKFKDDKPLHPSWEAKRKQKDKESGSIVPSLGKKIKF